MAQEFVLFRLAAILCRKYRVPSEPRSQAASGAVSTGVGDHFGTPRAAGFFSLLRTLHLVSRPGDLFRMSTPSIENALPDHLSTHTD